MAQRLVSVDEDHVFPPPLESRLDGKTEAAVLPIRNRHTVTSSDPEGRYNNQPGAIHFNEATGRRFLKASGTGNTGWVPLPRNLERGPIPVGSDIDTWTIEENGEWDILNWSTYDALVVSGSTLPPIRNPFRLSHYTSRDGTSYQRAEYQGASQAVFFRTSTTWNSGVMTDWRKQSVDLAASRTETIVAVGDSMTEGGANNIIWPKTDAWPAKLAGFIGAGQVVVNHGQSGSFIDEALLASGARPLRVKVTSGTIAATGSTPVQMSWTPATTANKWIACEGSINGRRVAIDRNGPTGAWTIRQLAGTAALPITGWNTFVPDWGGADADTHIIWHGTNDNTYQITGQEKTTAGHIIAGLQELVSFLSARNKRYLLLGLHTTLDQTTGNTRNTTALTVNKWLTDNDPGHTALVYDWMRERALGNMGLTPTAKDLELVQSGTVPESLMEAPDQGHISKATASALAQHHILPWLSAKGYIQRA